MKSFVVPLVSVLAISGCTMHNQPDAENGADALLSIAVFGAMACGLAEVC